MQISFIGYGNMAKAVAASFSKVASVSLSAASPSQTQGVDALGVATHPSNTAVVAGAELIILAVKPQQMAAVIAEIKGVLPKPCLLISLAAGLSWQWFVEQGLDGHPLIRCMPNLGILVNQGATPLWANPWVSKEQRAVVNQLFSYSGLTSWVANEAELDVFTALSGSGPAYMFLFWEAMASAASRLGLPKDLATTFTLQTALGALTLAKESLLTLDALRAKITSPGGTTAAALEILEQEGFSLLVARALEAAYHRAKALGDSL